MIDPTIMKLIKEGKVQEARALQSTIPISGFMDSKAVRERFQFQNGFGPHHAFDTCGTDWASYWFRHDALTNLRDDVVFSILDKYKCEVGCQVCYLNGYWMDDRAFAKYLPTITPAWEEEILDVFQWFDRANAIDDLRMLHDCYPALFDFYRRNSPKMEYNITDNGFFSQHNLLMNDLHFSKIAYLSFSDALLEKNDGGVVDKIIPMLKALNERSPVEKINFIMSKGYPTQNPVVMRMFEWVVTNMPSTHTYFHTDLCQDADWVADLKVLYSYDLPSIYYQENSVSPPIVCQILTETVQLRHNKFYSTLTGSTIERASPFYEFQKFSIGEFLAGVLKGKLRSYALYRDSIVDRAGNRYFEYFDWCVENLQVNDHYTFIPASMIPWSAMHRRLSQEWIAHPMGWLKPGSQSIVPIIEVKR